MTHRSYGQATVLMRRAGGLSVAGEAVVTPFLAGTSTPYPGPLYGASDAAEPLTFPLATGEDGVVALWADTPVRLDVEATHPLLGRGRVTLDVEWPPGVPDPAYLTPEDADARYTPLSHTTDPDPHSQYLTQPEADSLYLRLGVTPPLADPIIRASLRFGATPDGAPDTTLGRTGAGTLRLTPVTPGAASFIEARAGDAGVYARLGQPLTAQQGAYLLSNAAFGSGAQASRDDVSRIAAAVIVGGAAGAGGGPGGGNGLELLIASPEPNPITNWRRTLAVAPSGQMTVTPATSTTPAFLDYWRGPVAVSPDADNVLTWRGNGFYVPEGAVPPEYLTVEAADARYLQLTGGTLTGSLLVNRVEARAGSPLVLAAPNMIQISIPADGYIVPLQDLSETIGLASNRFKGLYVGELNGNTLTVAGTDVMARIATLEASVAALRTHTHPLTTWAQGTAAPSGGIP